MGDPNAKLKSKKIEFKSSLGRQENDNYYFLGTLKRYPTEFFPQLGYPNAKLGENKQAQAGSNWDQLGSKWTEWDSAGL